MKLLVATHETNGLVEGDYDFCVPGELLWLSDVCDSDRRDPVNGCGCSRGFGGLASHRASTTGVIADLPMTEADVRAAVFDSLSAQGWLRSLEPTVASSLVDQEVRDLLSIGDSFAVGSLMRRYLDTVFAVDRRWLGL